MMLLNQFPIYFVNLIVRHTIQKLVLLDQQIYMESVTLILIESFQKQLSQY